MSSFDTPCFPLLPSEKVCHLKRRRLYPRINQHSFGVRIRTHLTLKCSERERERKRNPSSLLSFFSSFYALQRRTKDKKASLHPFQRECTPCYRVQTLPVSTFLGKLHRSSASAAAPLVPPHGFDVRPAACDSCAPDIKPWARQPLTEAVLFFHSALPAPCR